ncbi:hypothetical protein O181_021603 [Austropuccinia psidii MF-1]|uniref:Uncharacterized protein n=1 Tax=Austropuccinia psidii MF-1 TaxID=1389203 RepID=A0A9Q3CF79_9BASI|nr:hypothetical protein [Austropuccinia psidii MF-1]
MRDSFLGEFTIIRLIGKNVVKVRLKERFSRKHPMFPVGLVKPYQKRAEGKIPTRNKSHNPQEIVEVEDLPGQVKKTMESRRSYLMGRNIDNI